MVTGMGVLAAMAVASAPAASAAPGLVKSPEAAATITWRWANGFYLQIRNAGTATGVRAVIHSGNGSARTQKWRAIILGNHEFAFKNVKSGKCLNDPHPRQASGTVYVDQKPCGSYPNADRWFENAGASGRFALQNVADVFGRDSRGVERLHNAERFLHLLDRVSAGRGDFFERDR